MYICGRTQKRAPDYAVAIFIALLSIRWDTAGSHTVIVITFLHRFRGIDEPWVIPLADNDHDCCLPDRLINTCILLWHISAITFDLLSRTRSRIQGVLITLLLIKVSADHWPSCPAFPVICFYLCRPVWPAQVIHDGLIIIYVRGREI